MYAAAAWVTEFLLLRGLAISPPGLAGFGEVADILSEAALPNTINIISIFLQERREEAVQL